MSNRQQRRRFRCQASRGLKTYLVEPDHPSLAGLLRNAAQLWVRLLPTAERFCLVCSERMAGRRDVGFVLLAAPATAKPTQASCCGVCRNCADLPLSELERAAAHELRQAVPSGEFEPLKTIH